ncbi:MAG: AI-2E family transporter [Candidatus Pacebacteria bacterium]|jgi:predicted PurR-regulated permease PerM|nr:AI-2E family transporter [Candidatus Paceibacterota bacterium]
MEPLSSKTQHYFFFALLGIVGVLAILVFLPYISSIIIALVCSVIFRPIHNSLLKLLPSSFAAFGTIIVVAIIIFIPLGFLGVRISTEAQSLYQYITTEGNQAKMIVMMNDLVLRVGHKVLGYYPEVTTDSFNIAGYAQHALSWSFTNLDSIVSNTARIGFHIFILLIALYYMLRDGGNLKKSIIAMSPLLDAYDEEIFEKLERAIFSVVRGSLGVSVVQGLLTMLGFWIFGIPNPVLWGSLAAIASLIPGIGTALVLIPAAIYLYVTGAVVMSVGLLIWAVLAVGLVDNFLGPYLVQQGVHIHEFLILLSVVGGLSFFGPIGFILGPLILSLLFALLEIYQQHLKN